jgi:hypothetical protein
MTVPERHHFRFAFRDVKPDARTVGTVLGYPGGEAPEVVREAIGEVYGRGEGLWDLQGELALFPEVTVERRAHRVAVKGVFFDVGKIVAGQLSRAEGLGVFVCTAGKGIEELTRSLMSTGDPFTGFIADTIGSLTVDLAMDRMQDSLEQTMGERGLRITNRYSPGYCGWPVAEQHQLFRLLPPAPCGVRLTDTALMRPVKSVSGFIGLGRAVRKNPYTCNLCDLVDCLYRRQHEQAVEGPLG